MCKYCRFKRCTSSGMRAEEVRSGCNSSISPEVNEKEKMSSNSDYLNCLQYILILENSIITAYQYPTLLTLYLQDEEEKKLLDIASSNWRFVSNAECKINEYFAKEYLRLLGFGFLQEREVSEVRKILDQYLLKSAELIRSRIRDNFEFAVFCQFSLIKVAADIRKDIPEILNSSISKLRQCFEDKCVKNSLGKSMNDFNEIVNLSATVHEFRLNYRGKVITFCQNLNLKYNVYMENNILVE